MMQSALGGRQIEINIYTKQQHQNEINSDFLNRNSPHSSDYLLKTWLQQGHSKARVKS